MGDVIKVELAAGVLQGVGEFAGGILIEGIDQLQAGTVVNFAEAAADGSLVAIAKDLPRQISCETRGVGKGDARRKILHRELIEAGAVVRRPSRLEGDGQLGGVPQSLLHVGHIRGKLLAQAKYGS